MVYHLMIDCSRIYACKMAIECYVNGLKVFADIKINTEKELIVQRFQDFKVASAERNY